MPHQALPISKLSEKKSLMKGAEMREDILVLQKKFHDMHSKKNALPAAISEPINLNLVCATAACLDEAKMKLSELSNTPYTFTFLPFEALQQLHTTEKLMYIEQCEKLKYDLLFLMKQADILKRKGRYTFEILQETQEGMCFSTILVAKFFPPLEQSRNRQNCGHKLPKLPRASWDLRLCRNRNHAPCVGKDQSRKYRQLLNQLFIESFIFQIQ